MRTLIAVCLDESGSMDEHGKKFAAISAFNEYLSTQKKQTSDECLMSLTKFNTVSNQVVGLTSIQNVAPLSSETYRPAGGTALFDAFASTIQTLDGQVRNGVTYCSHCGSKRGEGVQDRAIVVVLTDGEENSSRSYTLEMIKGMIREREARGNWTFVFLSAGVDGFQVGMSLGIHYKNSAYFVNDGGHFTNTINYLNTATTQYRNSTKCSTSAFFTDEQKTAMEADNPNLPDPQLTTTAGKP